jgi:DNA sulfur modification protein DndE
MTKNRWIIIGCLLLGAPALAQKLPVIELPIFKADTFDITKYGAHPDKLAKSTEAINKAIDACHAAGGGVVRIPEGFWITGPIQLKSNINLHLAKGAVLQFSDNTLDYKLIETNWEGLEAIRCESPLYGMDLENIAITGKGLIDGAGQVWRPVKKNKLTPPEWEQLIASGGSLNEKKDTWYPTERALKGSQLKRPGVIAEGYNIQKAEEIREFLRPNLLSLIRCNRVLIEGVTFQNSPAWCLHPLMSKNITVKNVTVRNPWNAQNGDGIDIESCRYVLVENSTFDVGDDGICIKSGRDEEGRKRGMPTEDVIVRNCTVFHGHGGFVVGSEMSGGARNIFVSDCNFLGTDIGLRFKTTRGRGGVVEKIYISDIRMNNIGGSAILFDMYYMAKDPLAMFGGADKPKVELHPVTEATPQFRSIQIRNVICKGAETAIFIRGLPEMNIRDIDLQNISIESKEGIVAQDASNIAMKNVTILSDEAHVASINNSTNITLDNISFDESEVFMKVIGDRSSGIRLINTDTSAAKKAVELGEGVSEKTVSRK